MLHKILVSVVAAQVFAARVPTNVSNVSKVAPVRSLLRHTESRKEIQSHNTSAQHRSTFTMGIKPDQRPQCKCQYSNPSWSIPTRTKPKCVFIDVGAADGKEFHKFLNNEYGAVSNCGYMTGDYEAYLIEANPMYHNHLRDLEQQYAGKVHVLMGAAYNCDGTATFYHDDAIFPVQVPALNMVRLIHENVIQGDFVIINMDAEQSEWDVLPCLADSSETKVIDRIYISNMKASSNGETSTMRTAKAQLANAGVDLPGIYAGTDGH